MSWGALGFFLFVLLAGTATTVVVGFNLWRRVNTFRSTGDPLFAELGATVAVLEQRTASLEHGSADLEQSLRRLDRSLRRGRILLAAWQDARNTISGWLWFLPHK